MRAVVTRVREASVTIDGEVTGQIGKGFLILLGITHDDTPALCRKLAEKVLGLDFSGADAGRSVENLGLAGMSAEEIIRFAETGKKN